MQDVISQALDALHFRGSVYCLLENSAPWAMSAPASETATFHGVESGGAWLTMAGGNPVFLQEGDVVVLSRGPSHTIASDPGTPPVSFVDFLQSRDASIRSPLGLGGGGATTRLVCGSFELRGSGGTPLLSLLPPLIHVPAGRRGADGPADILEMIGREARSGGHGGDAVIARLADVLFVKVVQQCIAREGGVGWLAALQDSQLAHALTLIHDRPQESWTVATLARAVGMSRSAFAARFTELVHEGPVRYLTRWRLHQAARELRAGSRSLHQIAGRTGYSSEAALSRAFKREFGLGPARYRQDARGVRSTGSAALR